MPQKTIELLQSARTATVEDKYRRGNVIYLGETGSIVITGDIHGHRRNFERVVSFADLGNNPKKHVILQEIIHGGPADDKGLCQSYELLFDVLQYKLQYPDQIHILMSNHDTSFICDSEVMKDGREMNLAMRQALDKEFRGRSEDVKLAISEYLLSQPLAVKCDNGLWLSHSLPAERNWDKFDTAIFERKIELDDLARTGSVYLLTWGRKQSQKLLDDAAEKLGAKTFVLGHQSQPDGWSIAGENMIIIASDHNHGCLISCKLDKSYTAEELQDKIVALSSIQ
ncbi:MAG: metallophosphoesterase [Planctomycetes bacterium]|nr:metallophosphoesterase [Planctomycetota bacterium]